MRLYKIHIFIIFNKEGEREKKKKKKDSKIEDEQNFQNLLNQFNTKILHLIFILIKKMHLSKKKICKN